VATNPHVEPEDAAGARAPGQVAFRAALTAVSVGLCAAVLLGLLECAASAASAWRASRGAVPPLDLILAAFGKIALTHALVWPLVLLVVSAIGGIILRLRRRPWRQPLPALAAVGVLLSGAVVVPADLGLAHLDRPAWIAAGFAACATAAATVFFGLRWWGRRSPASLSRSFAAATVASVAALVVGVLALVNSPLFNAASFRVAPASRAAPAPPRPHVLWIVLDTVRADRFGCYGYERPTTPKLDAWAQRGLLFEDAHSNGMWTGPGHASMFTGLSLREHGVDVDRTWLDDSIPTIAERLAAARYETALFSNNPWVSRSTNLDRGFQRSVIVDPLRRLGRFSLEALAQRVGLAPPVPWMDGDFGAALTNQLVGRWLEGPRDETRPVLLFVNYMEAHLPYRVPRSYREMFMDPPDVERSYALRRSVFGEIADALHFTANIEGAEFLSERDKQVITRQYDAAIRYLDDRVRELLDLFASRGMLENTIVVITSDHGEYLGEHGMWGHTFLCHAELTHVPLLLHVPGAGGAGRISTPVQLSDLYGTVLRAALGETVDAPGFDARDLVALAADPPAARAVVSEYGGAPQRLRPRLAASPSREVRLRAIPQVAVHDGLSRLLASADGREELQFLRGILPVLPNGSHLSAGLHDYVQRALPRVSSPGPQEGDSAQLIRSLRGLGYVGGAEEEDTGDEEPP